MMTIEVVTALLSWSLLINIILLLLSTLMMMVVMRETISSIHARLSALNKQDLGRAYFQYLPNTR